VPKSRLREFLSGLVSRLRPGALVVCVDNTYPEGSSHPTSETDEEGNTYQARRLSDGSAHKVLKNFPSVEELESAVGGFASKTTSWVLRCYWVFTFRTEAPEVSA
jgi:demethylmenaquinone methyltransferase/2-methoxy-6-polyprenyl-1,4-benzoquinol methylase